MYIERVEDKAFHMTCMAMPKHTYPYPWVYEIYNFGRTFVGRHYYIHVHCT